MNSQFEGSSIPITCIIDNQSKKAMTLKAHLKQEVSFHAEGQIKKTSDKIGTTIGSTIQPKSKQTEVTTVSVPTTAPTTENVCPIIHINYVMKVKLDIPGSFDLDCKLPVILTNEPLPDEFS